MSALLGCATDPTSLRLDLDYEPEWAMTMLEVSVGDRSAPTAPSPQVRALVSDTWAGAPVEVAVVGLAAGRPVARGEAVAHPVLGVEVIVPITMEALACDSACELHTRMCEGGHVTACVLGTDGCTRWASEPCGEEGCVDGACVVEPPPCETPPCSCEPTPWATESVADPARSPDLALGPAGALHLVYDVSDEELFHLRISPSGATSGERIVDADANGAAVAVDASGQVHVAFFDDSALDVRYSRRDLEGRWHTETVDEVGYTGELPDIAVDGDGHVHLVYEDREAGIIEYAHRLGSTGSFEKERIDSLTGTGHAYPSIALDVAGTPHVAYAAESRRLGYARGGADGFSTVFIGGAGAGWFSSLLVDASGVAHVSYYEPGEGNLGYAWGTLEAGFESATIASEGDVGWGTSIALGGDGVLHIAYGDITGSALGHASGVPGTALDVETLTDADPVGGHPSIVAAPDGSITIAHELRYAPQATEVVLSTTRACP